MSKVFGAAVAATIPVAPVVWSDRWAVPFYGNITKAAYDAYVAAGGSMSEREAFDGYQSYSDEEAKWCWYEANASGNCPYGWNLECWSAENFAQWLEKERMGEAHESLWLY